MISSDFQGRRNPVVDEESEMKAVHLGKFGSAREWVLNVLRV